MTTTTSPTLVCPPWCVEHFGSDPHLGNPDRTYTHDSESRTLQARAQFRGSELPTFSVELSVLSTADGELVDHEASVWMLGEVLTVKTARELGAFLLSLADLAEGSR